MGLPDAFLVLAGFGLTNYGFHAATRKSGAASLFGSLLMAVGIAVTFWGLLHGLVPGFFG
jgi:hypothetical protein